MFNNNKFKPDTINSIFEAENSIYRITYDEFIKTGIVYIIDEKVLEEVIRKSNYNWLKENMCFSTERRHLKEGLI